MRRRLFRERRQREAEHGLIAILTRLQICVAGVAQRPRKAGTSPDSRAALLQGLVAGINALLAWRRDQERQAEAEGWWHLSSSLTEQLAERLTQRSPLFEATRVVDGVRLDLDDVIDGVVLLQGEAGDRYFVEAAEVLADALRHVFDWLLVAAPTAATAGSLKETWDELVREVIATLPRPAPIVEVTEVPAAVALADVLDEAEPVIPPPPPVSPAVVFLPHAARFGRIELVAC